MNAQAGEVKFTSQFVRTTQIQMNKYARSIENGRRVKYPTFSTVVLAVLTDQFLPPPFLQISNSSFLVESQAGRRLLALTSGERQEHHPVQKEVAGAPVRSTITHAPTSRGS